METMLYKMHQSWKDKSIRFKWNISTNWKCL